MPKDYHINENVIKMVAIIIFSNYIFKTMAIFLAIFDMAVLTFWPPNLSAIVPRVQLSRSIIHTLDGLAAEFTLGTVWRPLAPSRFKQLFYTLVRSHLSSAFRAGALFTPVICEERATSVWLSSVYNLLSLGCCPFFLSSYGYCEARTDDTTVVVAVECRDSRLSIDVPFGIEQGCIPRKTATGGIRFKGSCGVGQ